jgi:hypothetical protein
MPVLIVLRALGSQLCVSGWRGVVYYHLEALRSSFAFWACKCQFEVIWRLLEVIVCLGLAGCSLVSCHNLCSIGGSRVGGEQFEVIWKLLEVVVCLGRASASLS